MITLLFYVLYAVFIGLTVWGFSPAIPSLEFFVIIVVGYAVYFPVTLFLFALSLEIYGSLFKQEYTSSLKHHRFIDAYMRLAVRLLRLKVVVTGRENLPDKPFIFISNHQSTYDTIIHKASLPSPFVFIAKQQLFEWPFLGKPARALGNIPMERESDRSAAQAIIKGIKTYEAGTSVGIYPEGTRSHGPIMGPFKAGAFKLATKPQAPIVVGVTHGSYKAWKLWPVKKHTVRIHFYPVIEPETYTAWSKTELSERIRAMIQEKLDSF